MIDIAILDKEQLSAGEVKDLLEDLTHKVIVLDVRSSMEYERYHIKGAININIVDLSLEHLKKVAGITDQDDVIVVTYCNAGGRGGRSFLMLKEQNKDNSKIKIKNLQYGINQWLNKGYQVEENI